MIANGKKYGARTYQSFKKWYACVEVRRRHRYSARTAYGERIGWKRSHTIDLGSFATKEAAVDAAKTYLKSLQCDPVIHRQRPAPH